MRQSGYELWVFEEQKRSQCDFRVSEEESGRRSTPTPHLPRELEIGLQLIQPSSSPPSSGRCEGRCSNLFSSNTPKESME